MTSTSRWPNSPGAEDHGASWAPARFSADDSETSLLVERLIDWLDHRGDRPFFIHASFFRPYPPYRNPADYHDLYDVNAIAPFVAAPTREPEAGLHLFNQLALGAREAAAPDTELDRRQLRATYYGAQREVDVAVAGKHRGRCNQRRRPGRGFG
jgi:hypothetical protein